MISEENFTRSSAAALQDQARATQIFLKRMVGTNIVDWDELVALLAANKSMLDYAASELHRVIGNQEAQSSLEQKVIQFRADRLALSKGLVGR